MPVTFWSVCNLLLDRRLWPLGQVKRICKSPIQKSGFSPSVVIPSFGKSRRKQALKPAYLRISSIQPANDSFRKTASRLSSLTH
ncbi:MAG TPA: hypothetical protein VLT36_05660, partial [Candidatus Dormibacteraeota bacterium]|nr:hypothetical protein [Candidatus Dormibacteraeota bacterium]